MFYLTIIISMNTNSLTVVYNYNLTYDLLFGFCCICSGVVLVNKLYVLLSLTYRQSKSNSDVQAGVELFSHYLCMLVYYFMYVCILLCMLVCIYACVCVLVCGSLCVCIYIRTYIYYMFCTYGVFCYVMGGGGGGYCSYCI